jgi:biopolymer transport protein ExbD
MRRRVLHVPRPFGDINVTPLIDVVMCLIVFFLIVGKLAAEQRAQLPLPTSRAGHERAAQDVLVINVLVDPASGAARTVIDNTAIAPDELSYRIRAALAEKPKTIIQLRAARDLAYGAVAPVIDACRAAGVPSVRLSTERVP